jgi:rubrerythrin
MADDTKRTNGPETQDEDEAGELDLEVLAAGTIQIAPEKELEGLRTLARLDAEAAASYQLAARSIDHQETRQQLETIRDDHQRHVEQLNSIIRARGGEPVPMTAEAPRSLLTDITAFAEAVAPEAVLLMVLATEELTNATYDIASQLDVSDDLRVVLNRNYEDEQQHLAWIHQTVHEFMSDGEDEEELEEERGPATT